jgi:hypothetical protein
MESHIIVPSSSSTGTWPRGLSLRNRGDDESAARAAASPRVNSRASTASDAAWGLSDACRDFFAAAGLHGIDEVSIDAPCSSRR